MGKFTKFKGKRSFTTIYNDFVDDRSLSITAKGLLLVMMRLPEDWDFSIKGLATLVPDGKVKISTALKELEEKRYLVRRRIYDSKKISDWDYIFSDAPLTDEEVTEFLIDNGFDLSEEDGENLTDVENTESSRHVEKVHPQNRDVENRHGEKVHPQNRDVDNRHGEKVHPQNRDVENRHGEKVHPQNLDLGFRPQPNTKELNTKNTISAEVNSKFIDNNNREEESAPADELATELSRILNKDLNGIELALTATWHYQGISADLLNLAAKDCLYMKHFNANVINNRLQEWINANVYTEEEALRYMEQKFAENKNRYKRRSKGKGYKDNTWKTGSEAGLHVETHVTKNQPEGTKDAEDVLVELFGSDK